MAKRPQTKRERRKFKRIKEKSVVMYMAGSPSGARMLLANKAFNALMLDICEGGMAILAHNKISRSALIKIKFILASKKPVSGKDKLRPIEASGKVRYNLLSDNGMHRMGVMFSRLSEKDRAFISKFK